MSVGMLSVVAPQMASAGTINPPGGTSLQKWVGESTCSSLKGNAKSGDPYDSTTCLDVFKRAGGLSLNDWVTDGHGAHNEASKYWRNFPGPKLDANATNASGARRVSTLDPRTEKFSSLQDALKSPQGIIAYSGCSTPGSWTANPVGTAVDFAWNGILGAARWATGTTSGGNAFTFSSPSTVNFGILRDLTDHQQHFQIKTCGDVWDYARWLDGNDKSAKTIYKDITTLESKVTPQQTYPNENPDGNAGGTIPADQIPTYGNTGTNGGSSNPDGVPTTGDPVFPGAIPNYPGTSGEPGANNTDGNPDGVIPNIYSPTYGSSGATGGTTRSTSSSSDEASAVSKFMDRLGAGTAQTFVPTAAQAELVTCVRVSKSSKKYVCKPLSENTPVYRYSNPEYGTSASRTLPAGTSIKVKCYKERATGDAILVKMATGGWIEANYLGNGSIPTTYSKAGEIVPIKKCLG